MSEFEKALSEFEIACALDDKDIDAYYYQGVIHKAEKRLEMAFEFFKIVYQFEPEANDNLRWLAICSAQMKDFEQAKKWSYELMNSPLSDDEDQEFVRIILLRIEKDLHQS